MSLDLIQVAAGPGIRACFTTRAGGVSAGPWSGLNIGSTTGDDPAAVRRNRGLLCEAMGVDHERVTLGHQVHGAQIRRIDAPSRPGRFTGALSGWPEGDGLLTERPGLALAVLGADCLPVLLWRREQPAVAAVHAGWRGLLGGALRSAVDALGAPDRVAAAIGPGVGPCCYPVDVDLRARFADRFGAQTVQGDAVDLAAAARAELVAAGVAPGRIQAVEACTSCEPERFYSYRRDGPRTGRHAALVVLEEA